MEISNRMPNNLILNTQKAFHNKKDYTTSSTIVEFLSLTYLKIVCVYPPTPLTFSVLLLESFCLQVGKLPKSQARLLMYPCSGDP